MSPIRILAAAAVLALLPLSPQLSDRAGTASGERQLTLGQSNADARSYRSSSFRSSSSWGRSSYSKPSRSKSYGSKSRKSGSSWFSGSSGSKKKATPKSRTAPKTATGTNRGTRGYSKPKAASKNLGGAKVTTGTRGTRTIKRTSSYATKLKKQRAAAASQRRQQIKSARSTSTYKQLTGGTRSYDGKTVRNRRQRYFDKNPNFGNRYDRFNDYGFTQRSYGGFDPSFLMVMAMSDDPSNAAMWYGLTGSPWVAMWMSDARETAQTQGDQEVLQRLDSIERKMEDAPADAQPAAEVLRARGIPAEVAMAEDVLTGEPDVTPKVKFGTGGKDGVYWTVCAGDDTLTGFKERVGDALDIDCISTGGSKENVVNVVANEHQCVIAQSDVIDAQLRANPNLSFGPYQLTGYPEAFWLIVNDNADIASVSDLDPDRHTLMMGGSGAAAAWSNLAYHASQEWFGNELYARFRPETVDREAGLAKVAGDKNAAMLVVMGMNSEFMATANDTYGDKVRLAAFDDGDFNDLEDREGNRIYSFVEIPGGTYKNLQDGWWDSSVETLGVQAVVVCNQQAVAGMGQAASNVLVTGFNMVLPEVRQRTLGLK